MWHAFKSVTPIRHRNSKIRTSIKCCLLSESHTSRHGAPRPHLPESKAAASAERGRGLFVGTAPFPPLALVSQREPSQPAGSRTMLLCPLGIFHHPSPSCCSVFYFSFLLPYLLKTRGWNTASSSLWIHGVSHLPRPQRSLTEWGPVVPAPQES